MSKAAWVEDALVLAGGLVLLYGTWLVSVPLAVVVGGLGLVGLAAVLHVARRRATKRQ